MPCRFMQCATVLFFSVLCRVGHGKAGHSKVWHGRALLCRAEHGRAMRGGVALMGLVGCLLSGRLVDNLLFF